MVTKLALKFIPQGKTLSKNTHPHLYGKILTQKTVTTDNAELNNKSKAIHSVTENQKHLIDTSYLVVDCNSTDCRLWAHDLLSVTARDKDQCHFCHTPSLGGKIYSDRSGDITDT